MHTVQLRHIKKGELFRRSETGPEMIVNHYNRRDRFGPANYSVSHWDDMNRETFIKPDALVFVGFTL